MREREETLILAIASRAPAHPGTSMGPELAHLIFVSRLRASPTTSFHSRFPHAPRALWSPCSVHFGYRSAHLIRVHRCACGNVSSRLRLVIGKADQNESRRHRAGSRPSGRCFEHDQAASAARLRVAAGFDYPFSSARSIPAAFRKGPQLISCSKCISTRLRVRRLRLRAAEGLRTLPLRPR
jgi:hypothetical protein